MISATWCEAPSLIELIDCATSPIARPELSEVSAIAVAESVSSDAARLDAGDRRAEARDHLAHRLLDVADLAVVVALDHDAEVAVGDAACGAGQAADPVGGDLRGDPRAAHGDDGRPEDRAE